MEHGVPQGSILGPLLFNLYINDLPLVSNACKIESYVDDSKIYLSFSSKDINTGLEKLKHDLNRVASWCCSNLLLINLNKTIFACLERHRCYKEMNYWNEPIEFLGTTLTPEKVVKDLGIKIDSNMSFDDHIITLVSYLFGKLCMIRRIRHLLDFPILNCTIDSSRVAKLYDRYIGYSPLCARC